MVANTFHNKSCNKVTLDVGSPNLKLNLDEPQVLLTSLVHFFVIPFRHAEYWIFVIPSHHTKPILFISTQSRWVTIVSFHPI